MEIERYGISVDIHPLTQVINVVLIPPMMDVSTAETDRFSDALVRSLDSKTDRGIFMNRADLLLMHGGKPVRGAGRGLFGLDLAVSANLSFNPGIAGPVIEAQGYYEFAAELDWSLGGNIFWAAP